MTGVLIAVEDPILRIGLRSIVAASGDCAPVGGAVAAAAVLPAVAELRPDVLVLDVAFRRSDPALLPTLGREFPDTHVLMMVDHHADQCALRLIGEPGGAGLSREAVEMLDECCLVSLRDGARGCVAKGMSPEHVMQGIRTVVAGDIAAAPWLATFIGSGPSTGPARFATPLTVREVEVLAQLARGASNKQAARHLGISEQTVKNHLVRIMKKLGLKNRLEVGLFALRNNVRLRAGAEHPVDRATREAATEASVSGSRRTGRDRGAW